MSRRCRHWVGGVVGIAWAVAAWCQAAGPLDAVARVSRGLSGGAKAVGSGVVIAEDQRQWYVLTNAHVAGSRVGTAVEVEFYAGGYRSKPLPGSVVWAAYTGREADRDVAVIAVARRMLERYPVRADTRPGAMRPGATIRSAGCPEGAWPNEFQGHIVRVVGDLIIFVPQPKQGRSGSGVYDAQGRLMGIVTWADPHEGVGLAQSWESILGTMRGSSPRQSSYAGRIEPCRWLAQSEPGTETITGSRLIRLPWYEPVTLQAEARAADEMQCRPGQPCPQPGTVPRRPYRPPQPGPEQPSPPSGGPIVPWRDMPPIETEPPSVPGAPIPTEPPTPQDAPAPSPGYAPPAERPSAEPGADGRFGWFRFGRRDREQGQPDGEPMRSGILMDRGLAQLMDWIVLQITEAFKGADGKPVTPGQALDELKRLNDRMDKLEAQWAETNRQWARTNDEVASAKGQVWYLAGVLAVLVLLRVVLPRFLTRELCDALRGGTVAVDRRKRAREA